MGGRHAKGVGAERRQLGRCAWASGKEAWGDDDAQRAFGPALRTLLGGDETS
jgi:hypothetical protein